MKWHQFQQALVLAVLLVPTSPEATAQEWTRFRGPNGAGMSDAKTIPTKWTPSDINWKIELPGAGHSSPVVWRDRVYITSADEKAPALALLCVNAANGRLLWKTEFPLARYALHRFNNFASATPAVDDLGVYLALFGPENYQLVALNHEGKKRWEKAMGTYESQHGAGGSPMVTDGLVILAKDQDGESFAAAYDCKDGVQRWRTELTGTRADYGTPCILRAGEGPSLLIFNSMEDGVIALQARDGKKAWQLEKVFTQRCVSSPVIAAGLIIGSCGSGGGGNYVAAVRPPNGSSKPELAYTVRKSAPYVPTSIAVGELLFLWSDGGVVTCVEARSGDVKWQERVGGNFFASPICVDGRLFCVSTSGEMVVLRASDQFQELARNPLNEPTHATPAVSQGRMYVRTLQHLMSVGGPQ